MTAISRDGRAVVAAVDRVKTQVERLADSVAKLADALSTPTDDTPTMTDDGPHLPPMDPVHILGIDPSTPEGVAPQQAPAADEEQTLRWARRESLLVLLTRVQRGRTLTESEAGTLRQHVETEMREADTARAVARGNLRHVREIVPELERLQRENEQLLEEQAACIAAEQRADIAETELRVLRSGLRANGADPTQIQNLWAQIRLRNRQWREAKREVAVTRSMLESEGGDVALVDEMLAAVARAEREAREAQAAIERVRALREHARTAAPEAQGPTWEGLALALDGTEQPATETP